MKTKQRSYAESEFRRKNYKMNRYKLLMKYRIHAWWSQNAMAFDVIVRKAGAGADPFVWTVIEPAAGSEMECCLARIRSSHHPFDQISHRHGWRWSFHGHQELSGDTNLKFASAGINMALPHDIAEKRSLYSRALEVSQVIILVHKTQSVPFCNHYLKWRTHDKLSRTNNGWPRFEQTVPSWNQIV